MKKLVLFICMLFVCVLGVEAKSNVNVYLFWGDGCPHCEAAKKFFSDYAKKNKDFTLVEYEVWYNEDNQSLMQDVASYFNETANGVPYIIIGEKTFQGYAESMDDEIKNAIKESSNSSFDIMIKLDEEPKQKVEKEDTQKNAEENEEYKIDLSNNISAEDLKDEVEQKGRDIISDFLTSASNIFLIIGLIACFGIDLILIVVVIVQGVSISKIKKQLNENKK